MRLHAVVAVISSLAAGAPVSPGTASLPHLPRAEARGAERGAPSAIVVATSQGVVRIAVADEWGHSALPLPALARLLPVTQRTEGDWAVVAFADEPFRFLLGAPLFVHRSRVVPLAGGAYVARDTLFVPLQWLADHIPRFFREGYRYDPLAARFEEARLAPVVTRTSPSPVPYVPIRAPSARAREHGFRMAHTVTLDPGHGGEDLGNPGRFLPSGVQEKHINLAVARLLRDELARQGIDVVMTRTKDAFIGLRQRAELCIDDCDLFVSIHVNSLKPRSGYQRVNGFQTFFLSAARTADAERVAQMENEALRYETGPNQHADGALDFILKDLHANEYLRESALVAATLQEHGAREHPGMDRGVSQAPFVVLAWARRPAVLVETGFATNREDARFLASASGQRKLALALGGGIVSYLKAYESKVLPEE